MNPILHELARKQWVWSATSAKQQKQKKCISTGFTELDKALNAGFPNAGMIHVQTITGCGELDLFINILKQQNVQNEQSGNNKFWVFVSPPGVPNAEYLLAQHIDINNLLVIHKTTTEEALWSAEQCAKSGACIGVFLWQKRLSQLQVRKLELSAQHGQSYCIWFTDSKVKQANLPLSLSISMTRHKNDIAIQINKQRVGWTQQSITLHRPFNCHTSIKRNKQAHRAAKIINLTQQSLN
ncbi:translesion DNA synthesis-associated protein ImuA [Agaribacter marinus]|nr:translesion DNA synthesis-associated protein ImuA [Agaribacter marinus]